MRDTFDMFGTPERGRFGDNATPADEVEVTLCLMQERTAAIAVSEAPKESKWIWLPKSRIEFELRPKGMVTVRMGEKLATEKGLI